MLLYVYYYLAHLKHLVQTSPAEVEKYLVTYQNVCDLIETIYERNTRFENAEQEIAGYQDKINGLEAEVPTLYSNIQVKFNTYIAATDAVFTFSNISFMLTGRLDIAAGSYIELVEKQYIALQECKAAKTAFQKNGEECEKLRKERGEFESDYRAFANLFSITGDGSKKERYSKFLDIIKKSAPTDHTQKVPAHELSRIFTNLLYIMRPHDLFEYVEYYTYLTPFFETIGLDIGESAKWSSVQKNLHSTCSSNRFDSLATLEGSPLDSKDVLGLTPIALSIGLANSLITSCRKNLMITSTNNGGIYTRSSNLNSLLSPFLNLGARSNLCSHISSNLKEAWTCSHIVNLNEIAEKICIEDQVKVEAEAKLLAKQKQAYATFYNTTIDGLSCIGIMGIIGLGLGEKKLVQWSAITSTAMLLYLYALNSKMKEMLSENSQISKDSTPLLTSFTLFAAKIQGLSPDCSYKTFVCDSETFKEKKKACIDM